MSPLETRYQSVLQQIEQAAHQANRNPDEITLVAVTKTWPVETILEAYAAGMRNFGENRAEELAQKRPLVEAALGPGSGIVWHAIGTLQSRKTNLVADHADVFHALDRLKIANRLSKRLGENGRAPNRPLSSFLELNISGEMSKSGVAATNWENSATQRQTIRTVGETVAALPGLSLQGLMTMAPWGADPAIIRQVFRRTRLLAEWLQEALGLKRPLQLSMGMTDDYQLAIAEGATHVRVGRAIFGERHKNEPGNQGFFMIIALANTIHIIFRAYTYLILARVILSWIRVDPYHQFWGPILRFVFQATEPIMQPVRRLLPSMGGLDFTPIIVLIGLDLIRGIIIQILVGLA